VSFLTFGSQPDVEAGKGILLRDQEKKKQSILDKTRFFMTLPALRDEVRRRISSSMIDTALFDFRIWHQSDRHFQLNYNDCVWLIMIDTFAILEYLPTKPTIVNH
jgi:hypothetical protein